MYMDICETVAKQSYCKNYKVGSVIVKDDTIIAIGYNGTPSKSFDNICEDKNGKTLPHVLHAESNAIAKCAKSTISSVGSVMYCTLMPCIECAKLIIQSGIIAVFYKSDYRNSRGIDLLKQAGIEVIKINYKNPEKCTMNPQRNPNTMDYKKLHKHMLLEHGVNFHEDEIKKIVRIVLEIINNKPDIIDDYPLFEHMDKEHGITLLESQLGDIIRIVLKMHNIDLRTRNEYIRKSKPNH